MRWLDHHKLGLQEIDKVNICLERCEIEHGAEFWILGGDCGSEERDIHGSRKVMQK